MVRSARVEEAPEIDYRGVLGRYALYGEIAAGGMATVHYGRLLGAVGFARTVAIKRLHAHLAHDPDFVKMFVTEARLAARIQHPNVVPTLDVLELPGDDAILLVMEYIPGDSLARLLRVAKREGKDVGPRVAVAIMCGVLDGLHAAHEAKSEKGAVLGIVHRDVSPQNIIVGVDGVTRVLDFGVAKATSRQSEHKNDHIKGKLAYMAPEQLEMGEVDRRTDVFAASVVLWQALTARKLFPGDDVPSIVAAIATAEIPSPRSVNPAVSPALAEVVLKGLRRDKDERWPSARAMAVALEQACPPATTRDVAAWVEEVSGDAIRHRAAIVAEIERRSTASNRPDPAPGEATIEVPPAPDVPEGVRSAMGSSPELTPGSYDPTPLMVRVSPPTQAATASPAAPPAAATATAATSTAIAASTTAPAAAATPPAIARANRGRSPGLWVAVAAVGLLLAVGIAIVLFSRLRPSVEAIDARPVPEAGGAPAASGDPGADEPAIGIPKLGPRTRPAPSGRKR